VIAKLDASGNPAWVKMVESTEEIDLGSLAISGSNVIAAGPLDGDAAFGPGETMTVTGCPMGCVAFAAFDGTGTVQWAAKAPSTPMRNNAAGNPHQVQLGTDGTGNFWLGIGGSFEGAGAPDANQLVVNRYDATGALSWNKSFPLPIVGAEPDLTGFAVDAAGNSYAVGTSAQGLVLGSTTIDSDGVGDFIAKFSPTGDVVWAKTLDLDMSSAGTSALAIGTQVLTFGNSNDLDNILPSGIGPMGVGHFDPATGTLVSATTCGASQEHGSAIAISGTSVYVAGEGASTGVFGRLTTTNSGVFVAKLK
jgi:hypothetical protein